MRPSQQAGGYTGAALAGCAFFVAVDFIGPVNMAFSRLLLLLLLLILAIRVMRAADVAIWNRLLLLLPPFLLLIVPAVSHDGGRAITLLLTLVTLWGAAVTAGGRGPLPLTRTAGVIAVAALLYLATRYSTTVWQGSQQLAALTSQAASLLIGYEVRIGPSFAGLWPVSMAFFHLPLFDRGGGKPCLRSWWVVAALGFYGVALVLFIAVLPVLEEILRGVGQWFFYPPASYAMETDQPLRLAAGLLIPLASVIVYLFLLLPPWLLERHPSWCLRAGSEPQPLGPPSAAWRRAGGQIVTAALVLGLVIALAAVMIPPRLRPAPRTSLPRIAFFEDGVLDFSRPQTGRYGLIQAGMFGAVYEYLKLAGYRVSRVAPGDLPQRLSTTDVLVMINLKTTLSEASRTDIWRFVTDGGGLMVLGDHTDLFGTMGPLNHLLEPLGVQFVFDSAFPLRSHWKNALDLRPHVLTAGMTGQIDLQIGTGASLLLTGTAVEPFLVGRYAFGDFGNRLNEGQGALLGDYRYQLGEQFGDLVLAATAEVGKGRVIVFGDTTSFQVLSIPFSHVFVERLFRYLTVGTQPSQSGVKWLCLLIAMALTVIIVWRCRQRAILLVAMAVAAAHSVPTFLPPPAGPTLSPARQLALVDLYQVPRIPLEFFVDGSVGGVFAALYRAGYTPIIDRQGRNDRPGVGALVFIDPSAPLAPERAQVLRDFLAQGGNLLLAAGGPHVDAANSILTLCGLSLMRSPLGPATSSWRRGVVEFVDAWPVHWHPSMQTHVHAAWKGYPIVVEAPQGRGRCLVIGDARFLHDKHMEGEYDFHPVNVRFLEALFTVPEALTKHRKTAP